MRNKYNLHNVGSSFDRLQHYTLKEDETIDTQMLELADAILTNCPVFIDFMKVTSAVTCNRVLSFLLGVIYAVGGESYQITEDTYIIATDVAFADGSLKKWIKQFAHSTNDKK